MPNSPGWATLSEDERKAIYDQYAAVNKTPGVPLGLPENAITVRVQDGKTVTTHGPLADSTGAVGGYFIVEADDLDARLGRHRGYRQLV